MSAPPALSEAEFKGCFAAPMRDVTVEGEAAVDIWSYVDRIDLNGLGVPSLGDVRHVYRDARGWYDQVLIDAGRSNVFLVVVVDRRKRAIFGHHLIDLNQAYGIGGGASAGGG